MPARPIPARPIPVLALALALVCQPALVAAGPGERDVTLGGGALAGTLAQPDRPARGAVLLLHGFTGTRDEAASAPVPRGLLGHTADRLAEAGWTSLRIDFRGSGESLRDLTFAETTIEGQVGDALAASAWLAERTDGPLVLLGFSQGGMVAALAAGRSEGIDAVVLWNAVADPQATYGALFPPGTLARMAAAPGGAVAPVPGTDLSLGRDFFAGLAALDPPGALAAFDGPLLVAQGQSDGVVAPASAQAFLAAHEGRELFVPVEAGHALGIGAGAGALDALIDATLAFLPAGIP
ncbi:alpha/beta hydrolase [Wenxinia saemankumensis]|uniref:AB hydrolase-1 domain-containing protein n=1 Tax=Wenxinia saemankumensis TaxID=1447782 RepID=A0A1M6AJ61_9RHOB|nr:alpha/beta fold hydrolase [Wenxinia saemankumensis]SHI36358.1 hypothetical protein SAMN05444417_0456 [Wenxinia saemankumensis]